MMLRQVTLEDIRPIAIGAGILGTGGGGNPYLGGLHLASIIRERGPQAIIDPFDLADDALCCVVGSIGAPTVSIEKLPEGTEMCRALRLLEEHLGRQFDAVAIADNAAVVPAAVSDVWAEKMARNIAISMGARAGLAGTIMSGAQVKAAGVHYTLSLAHHLGAQVIEAQRQKSDVPAVVAAELEGEVIFQGKITDVDRRVSKGFARGGVRFESFSGADVLEIEFQNEFLIAFINGEVAATTPDLICIVTEEEGEPVTTEALRYGTRVAVITVPAPPQLKSEAALEVVGPGAFGYDVEFRPLPGGVIGNVPQRHRGTEKSQHNDSNW